MLYLSPTAAAGAALILALGAAGCGEGERKPDPAVIDATLNQLIANDQAEKARLEQEADAREEVREQELKQKEANYANSPDAGDPAAVANGQQPD